MKRLRSAIIGCGVVSRIHIDALITCGEEIVALCDIVLNKAEKLKNEFNLNVNIYENYIEMLEKESIDVVHICTPHYLHKEMCVESLKRNINVLCEKPLAISLKQLDEIKQALDFSKAKLGVCMQRRFEPSVKRIKEILKNEQVISANGNLSWCRDKNYYEHDDWRGKKDLEGGGVMINQALHTLDLLAYFMGNPSSVIGCVRNDTLKDVIEVEESAFGIFKYEDGRRFLIEASNANNRSHEISISLHSNNHIIYYIGENLLVDNKQVNLNSEITNLGKKEWGYGHFYLISNFYNCIKENKDFAIGFNEGSEVVKLILALYQSNGKEISL